MLEEVAKLSAHRPVKPRIAFAICIRSHFPEMYRTAKGIASNGSFDPLLLFVGDENFEYEYRLCKDAGLTYFKNSTAQRSLVTPENAVEDKATRIQESGVAREGDIPGEGSIRLRHRFKRMPILGSVLKICHSFYVRFFIRKISVICLPWHLYRFRRLNQAAAEFLRTTLPDVVVVPHVDLGGILGCIVNVAQRRGIPAIVIPYAWILRAEQLSAIKGKPEYQARGLINSWVCKRYPQWLFSGHLGRPSVEIIALEWLGFPTANPWMPDDGADIIALESAAMLRSYVSDGVAAVKCSVTGSASQDILVASGLKAKDASSFNFQSLCSKSIGRDSGFVLSFLPPDQTGNQIPGYEYSNYWDMLIFWIQTVMADNTTPVMFSLHPRMKHLRNTLLEKFPKIEIYDGDSCDLIPDAKFCVGTTGGSLRYAIACSKPVLYYDVFNYRMNEFASVSSVVTVNARTTFAEVFSRFLSDKAYLSLLENEAAAHANAWGRLDGHALERIESLISSKLLLSRSDANM